MVKRCIALFSLVFVLQSLMGQTVFINEIHYSNSSTDINEGIEIAGPAGTDLGCYQLALLNGANGSAYNTLSLSGTIPDQCNGFGTVWVPTPLQNGAPDGMALIFDPGLGGCSQTGTLDTLLLLSYEGSFTVGGVATVDIGVDETDSSPVGQSLQLTGNGTTYTDFSWSTISVANTGDLNNGQTFSGPCGAIVATELQFTSSPAGCIVANQSFSATVCATNTSGVIDNSFTGTVLLSQATGPGNLAGTLSATFVNGCASLSGLSLDAVGAYTLSASDGSLGGTSPTVYISSSCTRCPNLTGAMIDACGAGEGRNEILFFNSGDFAIPVDFPSVNLTYGTANPPSTTYSNGFTSNLAFIDSLNTKAGCNIFVDGFSNSPIPPQTAFMIMRSNPDYPYDYSAWCSMGPIYVLFTTDANWVEFGNFKNCVDCGTGASGTQTRFFQLDGSSLNGGASCSFSYSYLPCTDLVCPGGGSSTSNGDGISWAYGGGAPDTVWNECSPNAPRLLPVIYGSPLTAIRGQEAVYLNWSTSHEVNSSHFVIERQANGQAGFQAVGSVPSAVNSSSLLPYVFEDAMAPAGNLYYRLRQVDLDGTELLSRVVEVNNGNLPYSPPIAWASQSEFHFKLKGEGDWQIELYDLAGKVVKPVVTGTLAGEQHISISTGDLAKGLYFYRIDINRQVTSGKIRH